MEEDYTTITATFLFEPGKPWTHVSHFETDINEFLAERNYEAVMMRGDGGQYGSLILAVRPKTSPPMPTQQTDAVPVENEGR